MPILRPLLTFSALFLLASAAVAEDWSGVASLPGPGRHHPVNFTLDGYGYVVTGSVAGANYTNDFFRYDPVLDDWTVLPDFPGPVRSYSYGGSYDGKGYLGFGVGAGYLNDLWEYDPVSGSWTELASCPGVGRSHPAFVITEDGKIFVGMGGSTSGNLRDWWEYDISTDTWTEKELLPGPHRHHPYYFNVGDTPYVGFGHGASIFNDFYRFDRGSDSWERMADFPGEGRVAGTQFSFGGKGYILSGEGEDHAQLDTGEFWEYDPLTDSWTELPPHPGSGRWAPGNFLIGGTVYFMCGLSTSRLEWDMWKFDLLEPTDVGDPGPGATSAFSVYPNPVTGQQLRILDPNAIPATQSVRLLDAQGRRIAELSSSSGTVELPSGLSSGQYFIALSTPRGQRISRPVTVIR